MKYKVLIPCRSDKSGKKYQPGDTLTGTEFPKEVIANWLEIGVLEAVKDGDRKE